MLFRSRAVAFATLVVCAFTPIAYADQSHERQGSFSLQADTYTHGAESGNVKTSDNIIELYGRLFMSATYNAVSGTTDETLLADPAHEETSNRFAFLSSGGSRFGIRGHKNTRINARLFWQIESSVDLTNLGTYSEEEHYGNSSSFGGRDSFFGIATPLGDLVLGKHNSPYKMAVHSWDPFNHIIGDFRAILGNIEGFSTRFDHHNNIYHTRIPNSILYFSPRLGGVSFNIAAGDIDETQHKQLPIISLNLKYRLRFLDLVYAFEQHWDVEEYRETHDAIAIPIESSNAHLAGGMLHLGNTMISVVGERIQFQNESVFDGWVRYSGSISVIQTLGHHSLRFAYTRSGRFYATPDFASMISAGWFYSLSEKSHAYLSFVMVENAEEARYGNFLSNNFEHDNDVKTVSIGAIHAF